MGTIELAARIATRGTRVLTSTCHEDEVVDACTGALRAHSLTLNRGGRLAARLATLRLGDLSANRLFYGADVTVSPSTPDEDHYLLTLPVAGAALFRYGGETATATRDHGVIVGPDREFEFDIDAEFDQVIVRMDRRRVEAVAAVMTGSTGAVEFDLSLNPAVNAIIGTVETAIDLTVSGRAATRPQLLWQVEQVIIEALILNQPSNRSSALTPSSGTGPSVRVRNATSYLHDHLAEPLSVAAVAAECGVSVRSLQESFRRELGTSPRRWLREQRLCRAHTLLASGTALSVTDVAYACGFAHLGDFGAAFKARFGVTPSALLASRR